MAVRASSEVVIDAGPEAILEALADIEAVASWSILHKDAEVLDRYPDGRPHHVRATVKIMGITDRESWSTTGATTGWSGTRRRHCSSAVNTASTT